MGFCSYLEGRWCYPTDRLKGQGMGQKVIVDHLTPDLEKLVIIGCFKILTTKTCYYLP